MEQGMQLATDCFEAVSRNSGVVGQGNRNYFGQVFPNLNQGMGYGKGMQSGMHHGGMYGMHGGGMGGMQGGLGCIWRQRHGDGGMHGGGGRHGGNGMQGGSGM